MQVRNHRKAGIDPESWSKIALSLFPFRVTRLFPSLCFCNDCDGDGLNALQMVLTIKLSSFAYNVWDGRKWAEIENDTGDKRKDR